MFTSAEGKYCCRQELASPVLVREAHVSTLHAIQLFSWPTMKLLLHVCFCPNALEMSDQMYRLHYYSGSSQ